MPQEAAFARLVEALGQEAFAEARARLLAASGDLGLAPSADAVDLGALLSCAYPGLAQPILARPADLVAIAHRLRLARSVRAYRRIAATLVPSLDDEAGLRHGLRVFAQRERLRVAARELLLQPGVDVDTTARELSDLADASIDLALDEARRWAEDRFGAPRTSSGARCRFVALGMGKLGGRELNCGSDVDLLLLYETDDGAVVQGGRETELTLHEHFARVARRLTETLSDVTDAGFAWRVDLRLRPEGPRGPLVNALAAAERYYETWGRTWERAALLRARPVAGDLDLGREALAALAPVVWRRTVDPRIAAEMLALVHRARAEISEDPARDLKHGPGGIREAEFFVQSLQLVWGGRDAALRVSNTLEALRVLRGRGLVTDRESREVADAYLALRRLEHRVQFATQLQTHTLPSGEAFLGLARTLGFSSTHELEAHVAKVREVVAARMASLVAPWDAGVAARDLDRVFSALDEGDEERILAALPAGSALATPDAARHLRALAARPDALLGSVTRDRHPGLAPVLIEALADAADPEQAARLLAAFISRLVTPGVYARPFAEDPHVVRRLVGLLGASAFLGQAMVGHPELVDRLMFAKGPPDERSPSVAVDEELAAVAAEIDDVEVFADALRRAKARVTLEVGLADLSGEIDHRRATFVLSALADAILSRAVARSLAEHGLEGGLAVIAMGKLGGREIGYGADLDLIFVYGAGEDLAEPYVRAAQRVMRLLSTPSGAGPGYELDTRLRPSGNQGLLVVSLESFARYHGESASPERAEAGAGDWERQALLKARFAAGDARVGDEVLRVARRAAYERGAPPAVRLHHMRMRMQKELTRERREGDSARFDLKLGRGGLVDVEFATQWLQMRHGDDPRVRTTDTEIAIGALEACGYLDASIAETLRQGYRFLRRLQTRLRVLHGTSAQLLEVGAEGLTAVARGMGMRDGPSLAAADALIARYREVTRDVRTAYLAVLGVDEDATGTVPPPPFGGG